MDCFHPSAYAVEETGVTFRTEDDIPWSLDGDYAASMPVIDIVNRRQSLTMLL